MGTDGIRYYIARKPQQFEKFEDSVFNYLSEEIAREPALLPTEPLALQWSFEGGFAVIAFDDEQVVGYTRIHPLFADDHPGGGWYELGTTWVAESHRGRGVNKAMYDLLLPQHTHRNILATSINVASIAVGEQMHFAMVPRKELPEHVWRESCSCPMTKTKAEGGDNAGCTLAWSEPQHRHGVTCFFRVTPETAARLHFAD